MKKILAAIVLLAAAAQAQAQQAQPWRFEATPYLWAAGMEGTAGIGRLEVGGIDMSFGDIMEVLRAGFMGSLEGRKGDLGFFFDAVYMKVHETRPAERGFASDIDAKMTQAAYALAATWPASDSVDLFAGARLNYIKLDLDLSAGVLAPTGRSAVKNRDWVDGYVGARLRQPLADRWTLVAYGDIGQGGADFTWQASLGVDYEFSKDASARVGYRYFKVEYDKSDFLYDMANGGAYAGVAFRF